MEILLVDFQVFGEVGNPFTQNRDLNFGGTGIAVFGGILGMSSCLRSGVIDIVILRF